MFLVGRELCLRHNSINTSVRGLLATPARIFSSLASATCLIERERVRTGTIIRLERAFALTVNSNTKYKNDIKCVIALLTFFKRSEIIRKAIGFIPVIR